MDTQTNITTTSPFGKLNMQDIEKGAITAVLAAVITVIGGIVTAPNFDVFAINWALFVHVIINSAITGFVGYLLKNLFTDAQGNFLGGAIRLGSKRG